MNFKALALPTVVLLAQAAASAQSLSRLVVVDGDAAPGFLGSNVDLGLTDQPFLVGTLPQLLPDGELTFRASLRSVVGGVNASDGWWITREGSFQCAAINVANTGIESIPTGQFGRMFALPDDARLIVDRAIGRVLNWQGQGWSTVIGTGAATTLINGAAWNPTNIDRTSTLTPRPDLLVLAAVVPPPPGAPTAGPAPGFIAGWGGVYTSLISTGQGVPGSPQVYFNVPDPVGTSTDGALGRTLRMNASGQWVARVGLTGEGVTTLNNQAIYRGTIGSAPQAVVRLGGVAPGWPEEQGATIAALSRPSINSNGDIAFIARTRTTSPASTIYFSLYVDRGNGLEFLARTGTVVVPSTPTTPPPSINYTFSTQSIPVAPVIGDNGDVAFMAIASGGESVLVHHNGQVHELVRRGSVVPRTGGRLTVMQFIDAGTNDGATGLAMGPEGDVVFSVPVTGLYDQRMPFSSINRSAILSWRAGRGVRLLVSPGQAVTARPSMHNRIYATYLLGDGNGVDGVPTGVGAAGQAAVQVDVTRLVTDSSPAFQAVVLARVDAFACGIADVGGAGADPSPDGTLDNNDFIVMIDRFFSGDLRADYGKTGGVIGFDDRLDNNDFVAFITLFFAGCD